MFRLVDICQLADVRAHDVLSRRKRACNGGCRCGFGADEVELSVRTAAAALEVAVRGADSDAVGRRRLADTAAGAAGDFDQTDTGIHQHVQIAVVQQLLINLTSCDAAGAADVLVDVTAFEDQGGTGDIGVAAVGAAADENLLDRFLLDLRHLVDVVRGVGAGDEGFQLAQVDLDIFVVITALVSLHLDEVLLTVLCDEETTNRLVCREDGTGCAQLCAHVGDGGTLGNFHRLNARADVLVDTAQTALDRVAAEHLEDDILAGAARTELAGQIDPDDLRHFQTDGQTGHCGRAIHTAAADGQHTDGTAGGGVTVGAEAGLARDAEPRILDAVHDAVARTREVDAVLLGNGGQEDVVIRGVGVDIQQVVVEVADRNFGADPFDAHALECQIAHDGVDVVGQGLVEFQINLIARVHGRRFGQMCGDDLACQIHCHIVVLPFHRSSI